MKRLYKVEVTTQILRDYTVQADSKQEAIEMAEEQATLGISDGVNSELTSHNSYAELGRFPNTKNHEIIRDDSEPLVLCDWVICAEGKETDTLNYIKDYPQISPNDVVMCNDINDAMLFTEEQAKHIAYNGNLNHTHVFDGRYAPEPYVTFFADKTDVSDRDYTQNQNIYEG